jgi:hypothetical protein
MQRLVMQTQAAAGEVRDHNKQTQPDNPEFPIAVFQW